MNMFGRREVQMGRAVRRVVRDEETMKAARARVDGFRTKANVVGTDDSFEHRWIVDRAHSGRRIRKVKFLGWDFCPPEYANVGEDCIEQPAGNKTDVVRMPEGRNSDLWMYLMRIPKEIYEANKEVMYEQLDALDAEIYGRRDPRDGGYYGEVKVEETMSPKARGKRVIA